MADEVESVNDDVDRREFLDYLIGGSFAITGTSILASIVRYILPPHARSSSAEESGPVEVASVAEIAPGSGAVLPYRDSSVIVVNQGDRFVALSAVCPHANCVVEYNSSKKQIECPCHGAVFDIEGNVLTGPPPRPLRQYRVEVSGDKIMVGGA